MASPNPITASMSITLPVPSQTLAFGIAAPGLSWGELYNQGFSTVDQHDHSAGKGLQIHPAGIGINADLPFNSNNAISLRSTRYTPISLGSLGVSDVNEIVFSGVDAYVVDGNGAQIRITASGALAGTPGSIGGLVAPASVTYASGPKTFTFDASTGFVAALVAGPLVLTDPSASAGNAVTIGVPVALAANYALTLPGALPGSTKILTVSSTGVIGDAYDVDGTTLSITSNVIGVAASGINTTQIANLAVTTPKIFITADLPINSHKVTGVSTPTVGTDAANKTYVDNGTTTPADLTLNSGYTNTGNHLRYWLDRSGIVHLDGAIAVATGAAAQIGTLPVGFRPVSALAQNYILLTSDGSSLEKKFTSLTIATSGLMDIGGGLDILGNALANGATVIFSGVTFATF